MSNEQELLDHFSQLYDFVTDLDNDIESMENEVAAAGKEMMAFVTASNSPHDAIYAEIVRLFSRNVFRTLPPPSKSRKADRSLSPSSKSRRAESGSYEEDLSISGPYLHYVFFIKLLKTPSLKLNIMSSYIDENFVVQLLELFNTEDADESQLLSTTIFKIYNKFLGLQAYIRKSINNIFYTFMYENEHHNGISNILVVLACFIRGFSLPLIEEHNVLLRKVLMPLHKMDSLSAYHVELASCVVQFLQKVPTLSSTIVHYLLKIWPNTDSRKSAMFLNELIEILKLTEPAEFRKVMRTLLFQKIAKCVSSSNFNVAECALSYWTDDHFIKLIKDHSNVVLPIMFPSFEISQNHWWENVRELTYNALNVFEEMNPRLLSRCRRQASKLARPVKRPNPWKESKTLENKNLKFEQIAPLNANDVPESTTADLPKEVVKCPPDRKRLSREIRLPLRFRL